MIAAQTAPVDMPAPSVLPATSRTRASFMGNRWPYSPVGRIDHSVRIAFVGDSMVYGQGVPFTQTLTPRVARHLNVARPGLWFDCQTFGLPGMCAFDALARAESHALPLAPDVLVVALTQNDAYMLRGQPASRAEVGETWTGFEPILATAFADFHARWRRAGGTPRLAVLYFDWFARLGEVRPADILRRICDRHELLFIDGTEPLAGLPFEPLRVSSSDGHLNSSAHDIVARHLTRALLAKGWIPAAPDYDDGAWLARCEAAGTSLVSAGVPPAPAASEALSVLRLKWHDRRNRARLSDVAAFQSTERRLLQSVREQWRQVAWQAYQLRLENLPSPAFRRVDSGGTRLVQLPNIIANQIASAEPTILRARTLNAALRHAVLAGGLQQPTTGLLREPAPKRAAGVDLRALAEAATARAARAVDMLHAIPGDAGRLDAFGLRALAAVAERSRLMNTTAALGLSDLAQLIPFLPADGGVSAVVADAIDSWQAIDRVLDDADLCTAWPQMAEQLERFAPDRPTMTLHLSVIAAAGPQPWTYRLGADSPLHAVREDYLAAGTLVRDGQSHTYSFELPLMLASTIYLAIRGDGIDLDEAGAQLRMTPARIEVPSLAEPLTFKTSRVTRRSDSELTIEYTPYLLARPE